MKSIRRTLLLNVLLLLVVTLGVVTYVVYRTAASALRERQQAATELAHVRYQDRVDEALRARADRLAFEVQSNFNHTNHRNQWVAAELALLAPPLSPAHGPVTLPTAARAAALHWPHGFELSARLATELKLNEDEIYQKPEKTGLAAHEYVQITNDRGAAAWTSRTLAQAGQTLPVDPTALPREPEDHAPRFETLTLPSGVEIRLVTIKARIARFTQGGSFLLPGPPKSEDAVPPSRAIVGLGGAARTPRPPGPSPRPGRPSFFRPRDVPVIYIQCAWDTSPDSPQLEELVKTRDDQVAAIDDQTQRSVNSLQTTLAWAVGGALAATLIGGWVLVGLGLFPLKRLSFAVSEISPKDFKLPIDPASLPAELNPVAHRLSHALEQLQEAFEREKRAAADISHELRTPLAALTTTIEVACRKPRSADQYRQTLDECRAIAKQMSQLVERMLELAWIDAGVAEIRPEYVEVGALVGGIAAIARPLAEVQGLTFKVSVPDRLRVRTDPDKLREVVMNLTHNAIEYNRPGGEVELTAAAAANGGVVVEVRDSGIGMTPEVQAKIFERFYRADAARHATGIHAGLGLAIVKEYVDRLGGKLFVDSTVGLGSRFRVELPNAL